MTVAQERSLISAPANPSPTPTAGAQHSSSVAPHSRWQQQYARRLQITDAVIVCSAVFLAQLVRFGQSPSHSGYSGVVMTMMSVLFAALWLASIAVVQTRSTKIIGAGINEYRRIVSASFKTFGIIAIVTLLAKIDLARGYLAVALPVGTIGLLASRRLWRHYLGRKREKGKYLTRVLAVGDRQGVSHLAQEFSRGLKNGYAVVGVCIPGYQPHRNDALQIHGRTIPILGDETQVEKAIHGCGAHTVAVTRTEQFDVSQIRKLMWQLETTDIDLVVAPGVMDVAGARLTLQPLAGLPLLHVEKPQYEGAQRFNKQVFDLCFSLVALIATAPLFLAAAIGITLTSKGPVFYRAERIGRDGKPFMMLKFRTMVDGADEHVERLLAQNEGAGGVLFKIRHDPRITSIGKLLRRFSVDELPQFINVLKRDMSVVGPRPPLPREVANYDGEVMRRLLVKPGITGLWQVSGRSHLSWQETVRLDLSYVDNWSMVGDLTIVAKTFKAVLAGDGAY
ncbi:MAG: sugar transferase [Mycobacteriaceae bacterium]|nr:sugar transferase [Mycobacteriaceae bacterium]